MSSPKPFRVGIVGAGVAGLSLSHALSLAGIDHIVIEKHESVTSNAGAVLFLWPQVARILDQFGILDQFDAISTPLTEAYMSWAEDGSLFRKNHIFNAITDRFNRAPITVDRQQVVDTLFENLPDKNRVIFRKKVINIEQDQNIARVFLDDGSVEECGLIVGADGVHSRIREHIWDHHRGISEEEKATLMSDYIGLFGVSSAIPSLGESATHLVYGHGFNVLIFTQPGRTFWTIMVKDDEKRPLRKYRYSDEEVAAVVRKLKDAYITESVSFEDVWNSRVRVGMVALEEGVFDHWHSGRAVIIGDAAHKMTPDLGLGANLAVESAVVLANILRCELSSTPNQQIDPERLSQLLREYQASCMQRSQLVVNLSGQACRTNSLETEKEEDFIRNVLPTMDEIRTERFSLLVRTAPKLDFVPTRTVNDNTSAWMAPAQP